MGFEVVQSYCIGQCESLYTWDGQQLNPTSFFMPLSLHILFAIWDSGSFLMMRHNLAKIIVIVFVFLIVAGPFIYWTCLKNLVDMDYYEYVLCVISLLNAILLYITLSYQNKSFQIERFETSFFNLLENHRKIADEMVIDTQMLKFSDKDDNNLYTFRYKGRFCFFFVHYDTYWIKKTIMSKRDFGFYNYDEIKNSEFAIDYLFDNPQKNPEIDYQRIEAEQKLHLECMYKLINTKYHITQVTRNSIEKQQDNVDKQSFLLFWNRWSSCYELYIRSLRQIFLHVISHKNRKKERQKYVDYILSQMSRQEIQFVVRLGQFDQSFGSILNECSISRFEEILQSNSE